MKIRTHSQRATALCASLGAIVSCQWLAPAALADVVNPSKTLGKLQSAKPGICQSTTTTFFEDGTTSVAEREVTRTLINKEFKGKKALAFEYTYKTIGFNKSQVAPKPRYDVLAQKPDGTIVSLAHEYGFKTSMLSAGEENKTDERTLVYLPGRLSLGKTWMGDSATIVDVDQMKSTITGSEVMDGEPTWIITQSKIDKTPSPTRGIKDLEIVYNLNPRTLNTTWIFSYGSGTMPAKAGQTPKDFKFMYYSRCKQK